MTQEVLGLSTDMESILVSAQESRFIEMTTTFDQPAAVGKDYLEGLT